MNKKDEKPPTEETPEDETLKLEGPHLEIQFATPDDLKTFFIKHSPDFPPHLLLIFHGEGQAHFNMRSAGVTPWMKAIAAKHLELISEIEISSSLMGQAQAAAQSGILKPGFKLPPDFGERSGQ